MRGFEEVIGANQEWKTGSGETAPGSIFHARAARILLFALAALILAVAPVISARAAEWKVLEEKKGGKVSREGWVDESGSLVNGPLGYAYTTYQYDSGGAVTERYYTAEGEPFMTAGGYCGKTLKYGNKNRLEEIVYLDENGNRAMNAAGYSRVRIRYMSTGDVTYVYYYGQKNKQETVPELGYAEIENTYRGTTLTGRTWLDANQKPVDTSAGYAAMIQRVNKSNQILEIHYEHADGSAAVCKDGWYSCQRELDKEGRMLSATYTNKSGILTNTSGGYAREIRAYLSDGSYTVIRQDSQGL